MNTLQTNSPPKFVSETHPPVEQRDDLALQGVAAHVKLLLKLIQEHKDACVKEKKDSRRMLRVATMMTILDNIRDRIQQCQSFGNNKSEAELCRCKTEVQHRASTPSGDPIEADEKEKLRKELNASLAARKSLQIMCSSLGKEKEIMATELQRKVQQLSGLEEHIEDLRAQNEKLLQKVKERALEHEKKHVGGFGGEAQGTASLQERNKALSEQLLRSFDGYRAMKRKLKETKEENAMMRGTMDELGRKVVTSLEKVRSFKERVLVSWGSTDAPVDVQGEIQALEDMFECFQMLVDKQDENQEEGIEVKGEISACKPSIVA